MELGRRLSMMIGMGKRQEEGHEKKQEGGDVALRESPFTPDVLQRCKDIILSDSSQGYTAKIEMPHGVSYLQELPLEVRTAIKKKADDFLEGTVVAKHSDEQLHAVDKAFDALLPQWRTWLPEAWNKPPQEERRKKPRR